MYLGVTLPAHFVPAIPSIIKGYELREQYVRFMPVFTNKPQVSKGPENIFCDT